MNVNHMTVKNDEQDVKMDVCQRLVIGEQETKSIISPVQKQIASAVSVSSIGCILGMVIAFSAVVIDAWTQDRDVILTEDQANWFASVVPLVSIPGSILGGVLMQFLGPRRLLLCLLPAQAFIWPIFLLLRHNAKALIILRALQGLLLSGPAIAIYVYPCEVSEACRRGTLGALPEAAFSLGFLFTYILASVFHWTTVVLVFPLMYIPYMIGVLLVPESPTWLLQHGKTEEAKTTLQKLREDGHNVEKELMEMQSRNLFISGAHDSYCGILQQLAKANILLPVFASTTLLVLKECTGQLVLVLFVVHIFRSANIGISPHYSSVIIGGIRFISNIICVFLLGHVSRKKILIVASVLAGLSVAMLGNHFNGYEPHFMSTWSPLLYLAMYMMTFGGGIGPVTYLMATELLPSSIRGLGSGIAGGATFTAQFLITFMAAQTSTNLFMCLWAYAAGCFTLAGFVVLLPETKDLALEKLEDYWSNQACKMNVFFSTFRKVLNEQSSNEDSVEQGLENSSIKLEPSEDIAKR
ncbi:hypothetical protein SK128_023720 [Halocaridina rubra]|uniref:Major facilitator superfamily (MFS) profile domain-containing protein n=1 Tax=Halocaridina rubra TaxID=373956 RepID=A0AAN8X4Y7_HALRR